MSVMQREIAATPVAVLDFETTGLSPKSGARVVEIGVVRVEPGKQPEIAFDTLVNPEGPVYATEIHGITNDDVADAPTFRDVAGSIVDALDGAVVLAYNSSFDMGFLRAELSRAARDKCDACAPPHLCLMWLRPLLGLGQRASLFATCQAFGLPVATHTAADDATVSAHLWLRYSTEARKNGIRTFADLAGLGTHKYLKTLTTAPYRDSLGVVAFETTPVKPKARPGRIPPQALAALAPSPQAPAQPRSVTHQDLGAIDARFGDPSPESRRRAYWHALIDMLADRQLSEEEIGCLRREREWLELNETDVRALHSRYVGQRLLEIAEDHQIEDTEREEMQELFAAMRQLGWAPGD